MHRLRRRAGTLLVLLVALGTSVASCSGDAPPAASSASLPSGAANPSSSVPPSSVPSGEDPDPGPDAGPVGELPPGPVTLVALGDSLTSGDGDDEGTGYVGRILAAIEEAPGRAGSTLVNLGQSGWDSTMMVDGQEGTPAPLGQALDEVRDARAADRAVLVTVLIGSNDLWYVYEYGPESGTPTSDEDAAADLYRKNLDRTVTELQDAGAVVVVGLPDDQSLRHGVADIDQLNTMLPATTEAEVKRMAGLAVRFDRIAEEVAAAHGVATVDTNDPFWADAATMADDRVHPNGAGYEVLADLFLAAIRPLL